jgi:hypothetical protein
MNEWRSLVGYHRARQERPASRPIASCRCEQVCFQRVVLFQPITPGLAHAELQIREVFRGVGVRHNADEHAFLVCQPAAPIDQVEPVEMSIQFEEVW